LKTPITYRYASSENRAIIYSPGKYEIPMVKPTAVIFLAAYRMVITTAFLIKEKASTRI